MPKDAPVNTGASDQVPAGSWSRVSEMQARLHRWAAADPGRRFDDLFNLVHDPATLIVAFDRVAGNHGANTPGADGLTVAWIEQRVGAGGFLDEMRTALKQGTFRPLPVRERKIPKPGGSGKVRKLGIPVIADRVVQAALKLVLEPIFEAGFLPVSYDGPQETFTGTPQGGILSPLLANIALSVLDEHLTGPWKPGGAMSTPGRRAVRRRKGQPTWRVVRYADDFVVLVDGCRSDVTAVHEEIATVLAPLGLRLSPAKTRIVHMSEGFDFLGFRIQCAASEGRASGTPAPSSPTGRSGR